jgi:3-dehydroquinate synthase
MKTLLVDVGHARYPIHIGAGLLAQASGFDRLPGEAALVVSNTTVAPLYLARLREALRTRRVVECILPDGEQFKTLATASIVFDALVENRLHRDTTIVALGGGVVGDIAGFAAACYQRGIAYAQVPTTLLAQVDSSVGGKTGVNHPGGKNLIGAFHQPVVVVADTDTLATLPDRELHAGLAEVIKYGCIADPELFTWLEEQVPALLRRESGPLAYAIARSCEIKAAVVAQDERERDVRAILNFGHTFAHAIEAATGFRRYLHGEAVALGMLIATDLSVRLGFIEPSVLRRVHALLQAAGLPVDAPKIGHDVARSLMQMDKKVLAGSVRLVLLESLGAARVTADYPADALEATLAEYFA